MWLRLPRKHTILKGTWFGKHDWVKEARNEFFKLMKDYTAIKGEPGGKIVKDARIEIRGQPSFR